MIAAADTNTAARLPTSGNHELWNDVARALPGLRGHRSAWRMKVATATGLAMNAVCEPSMVTYRLVLAAASKTATGAARRPKGIQR